MNGNNFDAANLKTQFGMDSSFKFDFKIETEDGFILPSKIEKLKNEISINLGLGIHYFYTLVEEREASWGILQDFISYTKVGIDKHQFTNKSISNDRERSNNLSNEFGKMIGIGFMAEYANSTWFCPLPEKTDKVLTLPQGKLTISRLRKGKGNSWPDYISAPFNPKDNDQNSMGAFYPLEFKGKSEYIKFDSSEFKKWIKQSKNISFKLKDNNVEKDISTKSWVLAFNYRCSENNKHKEHKNSTLMVYDPEVGNPEIAQPKTAAPIIREHLARQCRKLGLGYLAPYVLDGIRPDSFANWPTVYNINNPRFNNRHYIGRFVSWGLNGELFIVPPTNNWFSFSWVDSGFIEFFLRGRTDNNHIHGHIELNAGKRGKDIIIHGNIDNYTQNQIRQFFNDSQNNTFFIGQDADMIKKCLNTPDNIELDGDIFNTPFEYTDFRNLNSKNSNEENFKGSVQIIRNGSIIANSNLILPVKEDFW
ncbi:MAG: hypothetical protein AABZ74_14620 [Cyanobacteriota bacterium]